MESVHIVNVPQHAKSQDLHDLKNFLEQEPSGDIRIFIVLK